MNFNFGASREVKYWQVIDVFDRNAVIQSVIDEIGDVEENYVSDIVKKRQLERYLKVIADKLDSNEKMELASFVYEKIFDLKRVLDNYMITTGKSMDSLKSRHQTYLSVLSNIVAIGSNEYVSLHDNPSELYKHVRSMMNSYDDFDVIIPSFSSVIDTVKVLSDAEIEEYVSVNPELAVDRENANDERIAVIPGDEECERYEGCRDCPHVSTCGVPSEDEDSASDISEERVTRSLVTFYFSQCLDDEKSVYMIARIGTKEVNERALNIIASRIGALKHIFKKIELEGMDTRSLDPICGDGGFIELRFRLTEIADARYGGFITESYKFITGSYPQKSIPSDIEKYNNRFAFACGEYVNVINLYGDSVRIYDIFLDMSNADRTIEDGCYDVENINFAKVRFADVRNSEYDIKELVKCTHVTLYTEY